MYKMTLNDVMKLGGGMVDDEPKKLNCCVCDCTLWEDEPSEYLIFSGGDIVCKDSDCLSEYLISNGYAE